MNGLCRKVVQWARGMISPSPTLFDLCLAGFLALPYIKDTTVQRIYFIFYIIFLTCISIGLKPRRDYRSIPLMFLTLWAMLGVFVHSFIIPSEESILMQYLNMYILSEGFIYILFGALFMTIVIKHSSNTKLFYILIPIGLIPLLQQVLISRNVTFFASIGVSMLIYFILHRKWIYASILTGAGLIGVVCNWSLIMMKWPARPLVWGQLIKEIAKHPFVGSGFYHGLAHPTNMIWVENYGWLWRHNDYLSLGAYLGIFATICVVWFLIESGKRIGIRLALIPVLAIGIMSFFQMTMFRLDRAGAYLLIIALCIKSIKKGEG